ncbi:MAG: hypothetical protein ACRC6X_02360 [Culicoidibacterales bacterium]
MLDQQIEEEFGFTPTEIVAIYERFLNELTYEDWESVSIEYVEDEDIDDLDEQHYLELPTGRVVYFPDYLLDRHDLVEED